jgi:hypothetical protein
VPCEELDYLVVNRLAEIAGRDGEMVRRIQEYWRRRKSEAMNSRALLDAQIGAAQAQMRRIDQLVLSPQISAETEARYLGMLHEVEGELKRLQQKRQQEQVHHDPAESISEFYAILGQVDSHFYQLGAEQQKAVLRQVISSIHLHRVSLHLFLLSVQWHNGIATRPDVALLWRGYKSSGANGLWSAEEDEVIRRIYPEGSQLDFLRALPERPSGSLRDRAKALGIRRRAKRQGPRKVHPFAQTLTYNDLEKAAELVDSEGDKAYMRHLANRLALDAHGRRLACFWFIPTDELIATASVEDRANTADSPVLVVGGISLRSPRSSG